MVSYRVGIDVGGTNTDAVILSDSDEPIASTKTCTSIDITEGILTAFDEVLDRSEISTQQIDQVMLGTTHCTNAIAERKGLAEVGVIRIGAPATESIPPLSEWPDELSNAIGNNTKIVEGGYEFNGEEINSLNEANISQEVNFFSDIETYAVTGVFSPVREDHEERVASAIRASQRNARISLSHEIGTIGLIERENATIINAALTRIVDKTASAFKEAMRSRNVEARLFFSKNDGTLMNISQATSKPIRMLTSGPANSIRGAARLSGLQNGIVIDVGGTTTDIGVIEDGFPRESNATAEIDGIKANFRLPDIVSVPIGGGSLVHDNDTGMVIGPESVGSDLSKFSQSFGGNKMTLTDVEVAAGTVTIGSDTVDIGEELIQSARNIVKEKIESGINQVRTSRETPPAVTVGGGSFIVPDDLDGISEIHRPPLHDTANAVGVTLAQVSGNSEKIFDLDDMGRENALMEVKEKASQSAVESGADRESISLVSLSETPISYLQGDVVRISVTVAGDLR